ncbi:MAG: hypothetical protein P4M02_11265 [Clostridia bacterium]|nr:hypothetical protein [Clostridia bacterium]
MKKFKGGLILHLAVWNIVCAILGVIVFLTPDLLGLIGFLVFKISPYDLPIWVYLLLGIAIGEVVFFAFMKKQVKKQYPYL